MKAAIFLLILIFSNQSNTYDLDVFSIGTKIVENIMEIYNETNKNTTDEKNLGDEKNNIIGPYETELIHEVLISILRCQTITDYLYNLFSLDDFNLKLKYNISQLLIAVRFLSSSQNFHKTLNKILNEINIFKFEVWVKLIRVVIEKASKFGSYI